MRVVVSLVDLVLEVVVMDTAGVWEEAWATEEVPEGDPAVVLAAEMGRVQDRGQEMDREADWVAAWDSAEEMDGIRS